MTLADIRTRLDGLEGPKYWRSLEELADTAEFREYVTTWYEQEPEPDIESGRTPLPAICVFGWAPSDVVLP